ncbi:MAG: UvrD-helicase domain-containing protein [Planctomycetes bacterium]|nr:UvrD-helicase domain-containing protein [Planctomycetota bacterium]
MTLDPLQSQVITASAGTGKTYQLAMRYIALLARGESPSQLLATTFTRKSAGEMLDRVLKFLAEGALAGPRLAELRQHAHPDLTAASCAALLRAVVDSFGFLKIQTLDALLQRIAASVALRIGLPPSWSILEDTAETELTTDILADLLHAQRADIRITLQRLADLQNQHTGASVHAPMLSNLRKATNAYLDAGQAEPPWHALKPQQPPLSAAELHALAESLSRAEHLLPRNKDGNVNANFAKAHAKLVEQLTNLDWHAIASGGLLTGLSKQPPSYYKIAFPDDLIALLQPLQTHIISLLRQRLLKSNISVYSLISAFDQLALASRIRAANLTFADIPRLLRHSPYEGLLDHTFFSLDAQIRHVLLDEFQDTSRVQYQLIKPLLDEALSSDDGRTAFFVGDSKQSLYGWRGAAPELLDQLAAGHFYPTLPTSNLTINYRSDKAILAFVNQIFSTISTNAALADHPDGARHWQPRFATHHPSPRAADGSVHLRICGKPATDEDISDTLAHTTALRIAELRAQFPHATIAVLVRSKARFARLRYQLSRLGIESSQEGVARLIDSPAVAALLSLLHLIAHPGDTAARFHVTTSPLGKVIGLTPDSSRADLHKVIRRARNTIRRRTLPRVLAKLTRLLTPHTDARNVQRLARLTELATQDPAPLDLDHFVRRARTHTLHDTSDVPVRLMTVHNAKGLEFDIVLLPDLQTNWTKSLSVVTGREQVLAPLHLASLAPSAALRSIDPELDSLYESNLSHHISEELSVLYVALTRAIHHMEIIIPGKSPTKDGDISTGCRSADVILSALKIVDNAAYPGDWLPGDHPEGQLIHSSGTPHIPPRTSHATSDATPRTITLNLRPADLSRPGTRRRVSPSGLEGGQDFNLADLIAPTSSTLQGAISAALLRGRAVHALFELVEWSDSIDALSDAAMHAALCKIDVPIDLIPTFIAEFRSILTHSAITAELTRPTTPDHAPLLRREWAFVCPTTLADGSQVLLEGRFDRVVITLDRNGVPIRGRIVDFKTDSPTPTSSASTSPHADRVTHYTPQVLAYAAALGTLLKLPLDRISGCLLFTSTGTAVEIPISP